MTSDSPPVPETVDDFLAHLLLQPEREPVVSEIGVLQSIYGDDAIAPWHPPAGRARSPEADSIRYRLKLSLPPPCDDISLELLVSLPASYPESSPPQLQLLSRYIGPFGVDSGLFGSILKTFISVNGVEWTPGSVCVFDGSENVIERLLLWYNERLSAQKAGELLRDDVRGQEPLPPVDASGRAISATPSPPVALPPGVELFEAEPIVDRKSAFVGRACRISDPAQVPLILEYLMADRRIARAAHPIINAWRCHVGAVLYQDNDDDGESAAGGRLAHLLQILDADDVLVVVTRYYGGTLLGADRFKHINQAARNALEMGGLLDAKSHAKASKR
ncbi:UPF0029-domain-containing protein [Auriscalpium vulgare]|uniref:UPF0029-domain-containing protein n=1 Tax=Auriscalpium vulgare TaxID=40419 RepID=A0ACB8SAR6_9AGAM|nr:UPF0029-domain-containing protein [Auriscalpium vulgare]